MEGGGGEVLRHLPYCTHAW